MIHVVQTLGSIVCFASVLLGIFGGYTLASNDPRLERAGVKASALATMGVVLGLMMVLLS